MVTHTLSPKDIPVKGGHKAVYGYAVLLYTPVTQEEYNLSIKLVACTNGRRKAVQFC